jgi:hypothetical protein
MPKIPWTPGKYEGSIIEVLSGNMFGIVLGVTWGY